MKELINSNNNLNISFNLITFLFTYFGEKLRDFPREYLSTILKLPKYPVGISIGGLSEDKVFIFLTFYPPTRIMTRPQYKRTCGKH